MLRYMLFILSAGVLMGCNEKAENGNATADIKPTSSYADEKLEALAWLEGSWYQEYPKGVLTETWTKGSDTEMVGSSFLIDEKGDTMMSESIRLVSDGTTLWYIPTIRNQNSGRPVRFKELVFSDTMVSFQNTQHDYPQLIVYKRKADTAIEARIEGIIGNKKSQEVFKYRRLK